MSSTLARRQYIYHVCPWGPVGGGMFRVADYLVRGQPDTLELPELRGLDSRGGGSAMWSAGYLLIVLLKILWGRLSGRLVAVHVHVAERLSLARKGAVVLFARLLGLPVLLHLHAAQLPQSYARLPKPLRWLVRRVFSAATVCVVLGDRARGFVTDELGVNPAKIRVVVNGVPMPSIPTPRRVMVLGATFQILFLGNLSERKGVSDLLHALASETLMPLSWHAQFAGGGDVAHYRSLARKLGITNKTEFLGWTEHQRAAQLLAAADVLVLPSYDEGLPLVILEALGHGVAVICTPVGEIPDFLSPDKTALFVTPGAQFELAMAIKTLMADPSAVRHLEQAGRALYLERFSFDVFRENIYRIYHEDLGLPALNNFSRLG